MNRHTQQIELWYIHRLIRTSNHVCICILQAIVKIPENSRKETYGFIKDKYLVCVKKEWFDLENLRPKYFKVWHFLMHNKQLEVSPEYQCSTLSVYVWTVLLYLEYLEYSIGNCERKTHLSVWRKSIDLFADKSSWKCLPELPLEME